MRAASSILFLGMSLRPSVLPVVVWVSCAGFLWGLGATGLSHWWRGGSAHPPAARNARGLAVGPEVAGAADDASGPRASALAGLHLEEADAHDGTRAKPFWLKSQYGLRSLRTFGACCAAPLEQRASPPATASCLPEGPPCLDLARAPFVCRRASAPARADPGFARHCLPSENRFCRRSGQLGDAHPAKSSFRRASGSGARARRPTNSAACGGRLRPCSRAPSSPVCLLLLLVLLQWPHVPLRLGLPRLQWLRGALAVDLRVASDVGHSSRLSPRPRPLPDVSSSLASA